MLTMLQPKRFRIKCCSSFFSRWFHHMDDLFLFCRYGTPLPAFSLLAGTGEEGCVKFVKVADFLTLEVDCCKRHGGYRITALEHAKVNRDKPQTRETMNVPP